LKNCYEIVKRLFNYYYTIDERLLNDF